MIRELKINSAKTKDNKRALIVMRNNLPHHVRDYETRSTFLAAVQHEIELWADEVWGE